jgi:hypothetical protein
MFGAVPQARLTLFMKPALGTAYKLDPIPRLHGLFVYHVRELYLLAPGQGQTRRASTAMAQGLPDGQQREHACAYRSDPYKWLIADLDWVPCMHNTCE